MICNVEVLDIIEIIGMNSNEIPASESVVVANHIEVFIRYAGYKAGLQAAAEWQDNYDLSKNTSENLGKFIEDQLTFRDHGVSDRSLFHEMYRTLSLIEGATGYDLTSRVPSVRAYGYFWNGVIDHIKNSLKFPPLMPGCEEDEALQVSSSISSM